jgi:methylated-DNA-[protein]-cysteine S-methyltransferase
MKNKIKHIKITEFQKKVYKEAKKIPTGQTLSYGQIAKSLGTSARAVGQALKKNQNPEVPCHRVIKSDGSLGGYNKGIKKKRKLLRQEGAF